MTRLYAATHRQYDHVGFNMPETEWSESQYPAAELKPADWLPVQRYDKKSEVYSVLAPGKVVAVDRLGRAVPAGLKLAFQAAGGSTILTYTTNDVTEKTTNLVTGVAVTAAEVAAGGTYTQTQVTTALRARGLIGASETARDFISWPIGYAPYNYWQWCGGDGWNPALYRHHNFNMQHQVACGTDKILALPMVPAQQATETMGDGSISNNAITFGTSQWHTANGIASTTRYASLVGAVSNVVAYVFGRLPVARITANTPITDSGGTLATWTEVSSIAAVITGGTGYFYIDYEAGVMFVYEVGGNAVPTGFTDGTSTITYYQYETAATGNATYAMAIDDLKPGDLVTFDAMSNYTKWRPDIGTCFGGASGAAFAADPEYDDQTDNSVISGQLEAFVHQSMASVVGQVIAIWTWPRSGLEKVMTMYQGLTAVEKMPGTATAGYSDALNLSGAANKVAIINFMSR